MPDDRPTILQLTRTGADDPTNGHERRVLETARKLAEFGTVHLGVPSPAVDRPATGVATFDLSNPVLTWKPTRIYGWNLALIVGPSNPYDDLQSRLTCRAVDQLGVELDLVVSEEPTLFTAARRIAAAHAVPLLVNKHDCFSEVVARGADAFPVPPRVLERIVTSLERFERRQVELADGIVFVSERDRAQFDIPDDTVVRTIPNGTDVTREAVENGGDALETLGVTPPVAVFVGSYDYAPNRDAASVIASELAPALPDVDFLLVGRNPPETDRENVHTPGFVEDLYAVLGAVDVALCPLQWGGGTKLKMLDYLAAGLPTVTTPVGAEGIDIVDGESALVRTDPAGFVEAIEQLLSSEEQREQMSRHAAAVGERYHWSRLMTGYDDVVTDLL
jgi:glycosyltransferase involved in cell wall biosynthesis